MKDLLIYYLQIILPMPLLFLLAKTNHAWSFIVLFFLYALAYRPLLDGYRLLRKGLIEESDIKKSFYKASSWHIKFFKELYFEK